MMIKLYAIILKLLFIYTNCKIRARSFFIYTQSSHSIFFLLLITAAAAAAIVFFFFPFGTAVPYFAFLFLSMSFTCHSINQFFFVRHEINKFTQRNFPNNHYPEKLKLLLLPFLVLPRYLSIWHSKIRKPSYKKRRDIMH